MTPRFLHCVTGGKWRLPTERRGREKIMLVFRGAEKENSLVDV